MAFKKLQLNLLSQSGELINCVSCFAGQVSVFRAPTYSALEVYQRALAGIPGAERMSIFLDDRTYIPSEHYFVGFGEHQEAAHEAVVDSFFRLGLNENVIRSLCASYDLAINEQTPWSRLSKCEARRARLLLATRTKNQILILNDPFEPLANQWRERFAELISGFARNNKEIVVVTNLSYRPESWIDNQTIARIQVGEEVQRTIGFGAQGGKGNELVDQIRQILKDESKVQQYLSTPSAVTAAVTAVKKTPAAIQTRPPVEDENASRSTLALSAAIGLSSGTTLRERLEPVFRVARSAITHPIASSVIAGSLIIGGSLYLISSYMGNDAEAPVVVTRADTHQDAPAEPNPVVVQKLPSVEKPVVEAKIEAPAEIPEKKMARLVLDEYPASVKESLLLSFQGLGRSLSQENGENGAHPPPSPQGNGTKSEEAGDLLKLLATASDTGEGLPDSAPVYDTTDDSPVQNAPTYNSEEEKREAIRKRFLEAIERAQNMRRIQQDGQ